MRILNHKMSVYIVQLHDNAWCKEHNIAVWCYSQRIITQMVQNNGTKGGNDISIVNICEQSSC